jgi:hypothetical protein
MAGPGGEYFVRILDQVHQDSHPVNQVEPADQHGAPFVHRNVEPPVAQRPETCCTTAPIKSSAAVSSILTGRLPPCKRDRSSRSATRRLEAVASSLIASARSSPSLDSRARAP